MTKLRKDRRLGSSTIATRFCRICLTEIRATRSKLARAEIAEAVGQLIAEFPAMALLRTLQTRLHSAVVGAGQTPARLDADSITEVFEEFLRELTENRNRAARNFATSASRCGKFLTLSSSGAVLEASAALNATRSMGGTRKSGHLTLVVCESRPACEGITMARRLSRAGCRAIVITDAAMGTWIEKVDAVILGADWIDRRGFINKTGSQAMSMLARANGKPVYVIGDSLRVRRTVFSASRLPLSEAKGGHGGSELSILTPLFERVEWGREHLLVTESRISHPARRSGV
ncbi:MAG: hypothetical protein HZB43_04625 [candidate division Zixibacteria bacterium]|nr:hypothetical protein [candidate division Zixibacteria bacterium]